MSADGRFSRSISAAIDLVDHYTGSGDDIRLTGLCDLCPSGRPCQMKAGSAAQILPAWEEPERLHRGPRDARSTATALSAIPRRGWAHSVADREYVVASVSRPVRAPGGRVVASVWMSSGPIERLTRDRAAACADRVRCRTKLNEALESTS